MKKWIVFIITLIFISGCSMSINSDAKMATKEYLSKFKNLDEDISKELDEYVDKQDLIKEHKEKYKNILKRQYKDMKYEIIDEKYDGDKAIVRVKIEVYDLYKAQEDSEKYLMAHQREFQDEMGIYDANKYLDYKLDKMSKQEETVEYTIEVRLKKKENDTWVVTQLNEEDLEKIHGIYNYED